MGILRSQKNILIARPKKLAVLTRAFANAGAEQLLVVSDFDRTLTYAFVKGQEVPSIISVLRDEKYLTPDYPEKAHRLFSHYHAIETDPSVSPARKSAAMEKWWREHFALLLRSRLRKTDIEKAIRSSRLKMRKGSKEFFRFLRRHRIPVVIVSSSGLGEEAISLLLRANHLLSGNVHILSNRFGWNRAGFATSVREPIIHTHNKAEAVRRNPVVKKIRSSRTRVIVLGDSISDAVVVAGWPNTKVLKIGFLNETRKQKQREYGRAYDVVIRNDGDLEYVNRLFKKIVGKK